MGILVILSLWDFRPNDRFLTRLSTKDFIKKYDTESKTHYFLKVGAKEKLSEDEEISSDGRLKGSQTSGIIPFINLSPNFNPGLTLETYLNLLDPESDLLFQRPRR